MKLKAIIFLLALSLLIPLTPTNAATSTNLKGKILIQTESKGALWYVNPKDSKRYALTDGASALKTLKSLGVSMNEKDIKTMKTNATFRKKYIGQVLYQTNSKGDIYYISFDGRYNYLTDGASTLVAAKRLGLGITNTNLNKIIEYRVNGNLQNKKIATTDNVSLTVANSIPRIALVVGYVNQHIDLNKKVWVTDSDEESGATLDSLKYCKKWYPETTSIRYYKTETIDNWHMGAHRLPDSKLYTNSVLTIECVSSKSETLTTQSKCQPLTLRYDSGILLNYSYKIIESSDDGCQIKLIYVNKSNPNLLNKEMVCDLNSKIDFLEAIRNIFINLFRKNNPNNSCAGDLNTLLMDNLKLM
jgi:Amyloid A4 N-terminal heparin-binding